MATKKEIAQVDVIINGTKATSTIKEIEGALKVMYKQIRDIPPLDPNFKRVSGEIQELEDKLKTLKSQVKGTNDEAKGLGDRFSKLDGGGGAFSRLKADFNDTKENILGATNGLSGFKLGMFGVIGAVAALVGYSLYSYFTKTDEGATKLEGALGGLRAGANRLGATFVQVGEYLVSIWDNPKKAVKDFGDFLLAQITVRFKAIYNIFEGTIQLFTDFEGGIEKIADNMVDLQTGVEGTSKALREVGNEMAEATKAAYELALATDALEDAEQRYSITAAKREVLVDKLLLQSKNRSLSEKERIELLEQAGLVEITDFNQKNALAQENLAIEQQRTNQKLKEIGVTQEQIKQADTLAERLDLIQRLAGDGPQAEIDALNKITQLEGESIKVQEKIANRKAALEEELAKDREARAEKQRKLLEKQNKDTEKFIVDEIAFYRKSQDLQIALIEDTYEQRRETARVAAARELEDSKALGEQRIILEGQIQARLSASLQAIDKQEREKRLKDSLDGTALDAQTKEASMQLLYAGLQNSERAQAEAVYQIHLNALQKELELLQLSGVAEASEIQKKQNEIVKFNADAEKRKTDDAKKASDERKKVQALEMQAAVDAARGVMGLIEELAGENAKGTLAYKAFASADVILNGILEIQRIYATYSSIPGGPIIATGLAAISGARTAVAVAKINSVQAPKKFARGGILREGSLHRDGGIAMIDRRTGTEVAEAELNETILTGGVAANPTLLRRASEINVLAGGRPLYADGGIVGSPSPSMGSVDYAEMLAEARRTNQLLSALPTTLEAKVSLTEFEDKQSLSDKIKQNANA